ncbi:hypothetical protein MJO29_013461 [Puccinia striiformis f. sp. tritici]|nr:hypothetical protein MJO29_013461 [Puccinia striiformis f. sp. tritici]
MRTPAFGRSSNTRTDQTSFLGLMAFNTDWVNSGLVRLCYPLRSPAFGYCPFHLLTTWGIVQSETCMKPDPYDCPACQWLMRLHQLSLDDCPNGTRVLNSSHGLRYGHGYGNGHGGISYSFGTALISNFMTATSHQCMRYVNCCAFAHLLGPQSIRKSTCMYAHIRHSTLPRWAVQIVPSHLAPECLLNSSLTRVDNQSIPGFGHTHVIHYHALVCVPSLLPMGRAYEFALIF